MPAASTTTTPPANTHQVGTANVEEWLRQPGRQAKANSDIIFTRKDEDTAKAMIRNRANSRNNHGAPHPPAQL